MGFPVRVAPSATASRWGLIHCALACPCRLLLLLLLPPPLLLLLLMRCLSICVALLVGWCGRCISGRARRDAEGQSIVVEYVKGELRLHNNTKVGVMTNDPTWDWHLQNLNNYGTHIAVHADGWTDNRVFKQTALRWGPRDS